MVLKSAKTIFILALSPILLNAQEYSFRYFGNSDGLNNLSVLTTHQDHAGFIWVHTENSVDRFDGDRFESFGLAQGLPPNQVVAFGDAPDDSLLVGEDSGLYRFTGNRFEKLSIAAQKIYSVQREQGDGPPKTLIGTDAGLFELSSGSGPGELSERKFPQTPGTSTPAVHGVLEDGGTVWYGCGLEICRMDRHGTAVLGKESGLPKYEWRTIRKDRYGNLWAMGNGGDVFELEAGQLQFQRPKLPGFDPEFNSVPEEDKDGRILLPSAKGLFIEQKNGWQKVDKSAGLSGVILSAFEDRQHSLWIGVSGKGLVQWRGYGNWESYGEASGLPGGPILGLLPAPDGTIWAGTEVGLYRGERHNEGVKWRRTFPAIDSMVHNFQMDSRGDLWVATGRGLAHAHPANGSIEWFRKGQGLTNTNVFSVLLDRQQRLWVGAGDGLYMAEFPFRKFSRVKEVSADIIWNLIEGRDHSIWVGGAGGVYRFVNGQWKNWTRADGLSNQVVISLGEDAQGAIWVGYRFGGGVDRIHPTAGGETIEKGVQRPGNDGVGYFFGRDSWERVYAGTERGVDVWNGWHWSHYDMSDGLVWNDCDLDGFAKDSDGSLWIGTSGGLSHFRPSPPSTSKTPLRVVFTRLSMGQRDISSQRNPSFHFEENSLDVRYAAPNALRMNDTHFRYRLEGAGSAWTETAQRALQFARLAPGEYRLEVQAQDESGMWSDDEAAFPFRIMAPWYRTWWFAVVCALIPLVTVIVVARLRVLSGQRKERELLTIVEERTADLQQRTADLQHANEELSRLSLTDPLTGLANRRALDQLLEKECARMNRTGVPVSLILFDVDFFKKLNDSLGHQSGDEYLISVAKELKGVAKRSMDMAARYGGEEFALVLPETDLPTARLIAESARAAIAGRNLPHPASAIGPFVTVSAGIASGMLEEWSTPEKLISSADRMLYRAKELGRNRVVSAEPVSSEETFSLTEVLTAK